MNIFPLKCEASSLKMQWCRCTKDFSHGRLAGYLSFPSQSHGLARWQRIVDIQDGGSRYRSSATFAIDDSLSSKIE